MSQKLRFLSSRKLAGYLEGWLSIGLNLILFTAKLAVGRQIGSVAAVADAWHTLSDSLTSLLVIISFWIAARPADDRHHFGHGRAEVIGSVIIATLLAVVGVNFLKESVERLVHHEAIVFSRLAILIFLSSAILKEALALLSFRLGKIFQSSSLVADAWHHRSDAIASALIVIGALFSQQWWWVDGVLGVGVSGLILFAVASLFRRSISSLLGESPAPSLEEKIKKTILDVDHRLGEVHHLHVHDYGEHRELTVHVRLPWRMSLDEAHTIASQVEKVLREELQLEPTIHLEPERFSLDQKKKKQASKNS